jgi:hypothetical protein
VANKEPTPKPILNQSNTMEMKFTWLETLVMSMVAQTKSNATMAKKVKEQKTPHLLARRGENIK